MAEYVLTHGDDPAEVARLLIDNSDDPDHVHWYPRPDVPAGGVFVVQDDAVAASISQEMARRRSVAEADRLDLGADSGADSVEVVDADEVDETAGQGDGDEDGEPDSGEVVDDPATPEDESKMTPAQRRAARKAKAAAPAPAEGESE